jgi:hypothetical protein
LENDATKPVAETGAQANIKTRPRFSGRRLICTLVAAVVIVPTLMATVADNLWAAIELAYYRAAATNNAVFLEWATVREVNIDGFEILCKRVNDPDINFHPIGSRIALGNPTTGSTYNFDVTSGLFPGERYCFRLREITHDGTPGEAFDLCGYGLGLTPPPTAAVTVQVGIPVTLTPTVVAVGQVPGLTPAPTLAPTIDPFATATPTIDPFATATPTVDPFATPTFTPSPSPTVVVQATSPLLSPELAPTPTGTLTPAVSMQDQDPLAAQLPLTETPVEEPTATATETVVVTPTEVVTATLTQTPTATATLTTTFPISSPQGVDPNGLPSIPDSGAVAAADATATPIYVVVTATPTPQAALVVAPTFTPWPTAVPTETFGLTNLLVPSTQNLMVGLLCLIFLSASGLGALGLVTSVLYMRAQTRRDRLPGDRLPGPIYERRRY